MPMFNDLEKLSSILDEHIEKGLSLEPKSKIEQFEEQLSKGLTFDPMRPVDMHADSPYYNPYKYQPGEGFMPYEAKHWAAQGKDPENYLATTQLYNTLNARTTNIKDRDKVFEKSMKGFKKFRAILDVDIVKAGAVPVKSNKPAATPAPAPAGRKVPIGTIHTYKDGQRYQKVDEGQWVPMAGLEDNSHAKYLNHFDPAAREKAHSQIEAHAADHQESLGRIKEEIDRRNQHEDTKRQATHTALKEMSGAKGLHPDVKDHLKAAADKYSDENNKKEHLSGLNQKISSATAKNHHVDVSFSHNGKNFKHSFKNIEAGSKDEAKKKVEEGMAQLHQLKGHKINKMNAKEAERLPETGIYNPKKSLGIKRKDMPQIAGDDQKGFLSYLKERGVKSESVKIKASDLTPAQSEMDAGASKRLQGSEKMKSPIIISKDNYIMDGHHRWLANRMQNEDQKVNAVKIDMKGEDLVHVMREAPQSFSRDIKNEVTTAQANKNDNGEYKPERKKLHDEILHNHLDKVHSVPPPEGQKPVLILTGGGSGSGKSAVVREAMKQMKEDLVHVDSDQIKSEIPEYQKMVKDGNTQAAALTHDESSELAMEMVRKALDESKPCLLDGTMKNPEKYRQLIAQAKAKGFEVHINFADVPLETAKERAAARAERTGRKVPENVIEESHKGAIKSLHELADLADSTTVYSTVKEPKVVYKKDNLKGVAEKDEAYLEDMKKRGHLLKSEDPARKESDVLKKFYDSLSKVKPNYDDHDDAEDPAFDSKLKYEGESNEQRK